MRFRNFCQHAINVFNPNDEQVMVLPSEGKAECVEIPGEVVGGDFGSEIYGIKAAELRAPSTYGPVIGLPEPEEGVFLVVGALVAGHPDVRNRKDILRPGPQTGKLRDVGGFPKGCYGLIFAADR